MEGLETLDFNNFVKKVLSQGNSSVDNNVVNIIKEFYSLKLQNDELLKNPNKKILRTIPDFVKMAKADYNKETNKGSPVKTNLPIVFTEESRCLSINIRDFENKKDIMEVKINIDFQNINLNKLANLEKELLLYGINSIKNKKISIQNITLEEKRISKLESLKEDWKQLKDTISKFTIKNSKLLAKIKKLNEDNTKVHKNIISRYNSSELLNFENKLFLKNITNSSLDGGDKKKLIEYYITNNIIINKYNEINSLFDNSQHEFIGSVVYNNSSEIDSSNIYITLRETSTTMMDITDLNGKLMNVDKNDYTLIYDKINNILPKIQDISDKIIINNSSLNITKSVPKESILYKGKSPIIYKEPVNSYIIREYNDLSDTASDTDSFISQEILQIPIFKLVNTFKDLNSLIDSDSEEKIYIYPGINNSKTGGGLINALKDGILVKEECGPNKTLNSIKDWRNKITTSYINYYKNNGETLPIVVDGNCFSSVYNYMMFYLNSNNPDKADIYKLEGTKGGKLNSTDIEELYTKFNQKEEKLSDDSEMFFYEKDNDLQIPNYLLEFLKATIAKFSQSELLKTILVATNDYTIINAICDNSSAGEYEIFKIFILARKIIRNGTVLNVYSNFNLDLEMSKKVITSIKSKKLNQFITIKADKLITRQKQLKEDVVDYSDFSYPELDTDVFMMKVREISQAKLLKKYVTEVLGKILYNVPGNGNCMFYAFVLVLYEKGIFANLTGNLKKIFNKKILTPTLEGVTINDRLHNKPILKYAALEIKKIVGEIIEFNFQKYKEFSDSLDIEKTNEKKVYYELVTSGGENILVVTDEVIDSQAPKKLRNVYKSLRNLINFVEYSRVYSNMEDYITSIKNDVRMVGDFEKGWGGEYELFVLSSLFCVDIWSIPSNYEDIDLENFQFTYAEFSKNCIIPDKYKQSFSKIEIVKLGHILNSPQNNNIINYMAIVDNPYFESELSEKIITEEREEEEDLLTLVDMGFGIDSSRKALIVSKNNLEGAVNYLLKFAKQQAELVEGVDMFNIDFQTNNLEVVISGSKTYISDFHEDGVYFGNYEFLEEAHDYIQWLFPNEDSSSYSGDTRFILKTKEKKILKKSALAKNNLIESFKTMFDFYGGSLEITYDDRLDSPGFNYRNNEEHLDRIYNINNKLHNCLRITRILTYLDLMEMFSLRDMFLNYLIESIFFWKASSRVIWKPQIFDSIRNYWIPSISDSEQLQYFIDVFNAKMSGREEAGTGTEEAETPSTFTGGSNKIKALSNTKVFESLEDSYMQFPYKYNDKIYDIVYVIYGDENLKQNTEILGFLHKSNKIIYDKNIKVGTNLDNILEEVHNKVCKKQLLLDKMQIEKLDYKKDIENNNVYIENKLIGRLLRNGKIRFN